MFPRWQRDPEAASLTHSVSEINRELERMRGQLEFARVQLSLIAAMTSEKQVRTAALNTIDHLQPQERSSDDR